MEKQSGAGRGSEAVERGSWGVYHWSTGSSLWENCTSSGVATGIILQRLLSVEGEAHDSVQPQKESAETSEPS